MKFSSDISLTDRASISLISSFWNKKEIITNIKSLLLSDHIDRIWPNVEKDVLLNLSKITLPELLNLNLNNLIQPMGMEILKWIVFTRSTFQAYSYVPESIVFYWTEKGTLDYKKTTQFIIDYSFHKTLCFRLACIFCIEKTIFQLWPEVGQILYENMNNDPSIMESVIVIYWVYYLNNEIENLMALTEYCGVKNAHEFAFLLTLDNKSLNSLSYFLEHIQPERRLKLVLQALNKIFRAAKSYDGNVLIFLFGNLKESEINSLIQENSYCVLASLLEWPCQEFFMPVANLSWDRLSNLDYLNLFQDIVSYVSKYSVCNLYKNLAKKFWRSSPWSFKEYVISKCTSGTFLSRLFLRDNTDEIILMILNDCNPNERREMIFYFEGMNICDLLVKREKWNSLKLFITSCIPSLDILEDFIVQYETSKPCYSNEETALRTDILIKKIREWF